DLPMHLVRNGSARFTSSTSAHHIGCSRKLARRASFEVALFGGHLEDSWNVKKEARSVPDPRFLQEPGRPGSGRPAIGPAEEGASRWLSCKMPRPNSSVF